MSYHDDEESTLYDPPLTKRGRSRSFSASASAPTVFRSSSLPRRGSFSASRTSFQGDVPYNDGARFTDGDKQLQTPLVKLYDSLDRSTYSDEEADRQANGGRGYRDGVVYDGPGTEVGVGPSGQMREDEEADRKKRREGRQSKGQEEPAVAHTPDMEQFLAQCYDLTHSIDALENDVDQILSLRNKIASLHPSEDVGQVSLRADMEALSALTTQSGRAIVSLEVWLTRLKQWSSMLRKWIKEGTVHATLQEVGEIKYQLASAKMDFADAMERIREGAWKEEERRERTRIWMARHMRSREPEMEDDEIRKLLKAAELGAADGVAQSDVTSYAGLWALRNPFTELAELTNGMAFLHDGLDREILDTVTGKSAKKRVINLNAPNASTRRSSTRSKKSTGSSTTFVRRSGGFTGKTSSSSAAAMGGQPLPQGSYKYARAEDYMREKDLEYGYAKMQQGDRVRSRKKMVIALLLVIIAALVLFVILAMHKDSSSSSPSSSSDLNSSNSTSGSASPSSSNTFDNGLYHPTTMGETVPISSATSTSPSSSSSSESSSSAESSSQSSSSHSSSSSSSTDLTSSTSDPSSSSSTETTSSSVVWWTPASATSAQTTSQAAETTSSSGWSWGVGNS
ncbi:hypothetical protein BCR35DRAFT_333916 [Leucosporidium creatinivorum]|uniref:Uncharacterized protein n=1 Tax=Leucosporidium creatinivorum TaxID=106004 RepID=A0A1Y2EMJ2_9BASI|nr:hypothetical protein BCR35DRAFT_333916 [Leucosporidium creatinivorum]